MQAGSGSRGMIVEFIGISGAGKSTICGFARDEFLRAGIRATDAHQVVDRIKNEGVAPWLTSRMGLPSKADKRLRRRLKRLRAAALKNFTEHYPKPHELVEARLDWMRGVSAEEATLVEPWVARQMANFELLQEQRDDWSICFWDEGIAQRCVNLFALVAETGEPDGVEQFLTEWPLPDALVDVRVSQEIADARMEQRGRIPRLANANPDEVVRFLARSRCVVDAMASEARRRAIPVFTLGNDESGDPARPAMEGWDACVEGLSKLIRKD